MTDARPPRPRPTAELHSLVAPNAPACRASQHQGAALGVATSWLKSSAADGEGVAAALAARLAREIEPRAPCRGRRDRAGVVGAALGLPVGALLDALAYTTTRDVLSAAVRLNLVGPLQAIALQADVCAALPRLHEELLEADADEARMIERAAAASPLLEATHACHELLEMRLFQT